MSMEIEHIEITEKVYRALKQMILNREFCGGQKLDLNILATQMKISRTPLKDAINRLVSDGLVEVKPRSGTFITQITSEDIRYIMELRIMTELWSLSKLTPESARILADSLKQNVELSRRTVELDPFSYEEFLDLDIGFHQKIVQVCDNPKIFEQYMSGNNFLKFARVFYFKSKERSFKGQMEHEEIHTHIGLFQLEEAKTQLLIHLENSMKTMIDLLEENGGSI